MRAAPAKNPKFKKNSKVEWSWLGRTIEGVVEDVFESTVSQSIKKKRITRHGSPDNPAYLVRSEAGNKALKLQSEIRPASAKKSRSIASLKSRTRPQMFS